MVDKVRENKARRVAERRGLRLEKSRRRDPSAVDFERYMLVDEKTGRQVLGGGTPPFTASINDVEAFLARTPAGRKQPKAPPAPIEPPGETLAGLMVRWLEENPERLKEVVKDTDLLPEEAVRYVLKHDRSEYAVHLQATALVQLFEYMQTIDPSPLAATMLAMVRPIASLK